MVCISSSISRATRADQHIKLWTIQTPACTWDHTWFPRSISNPHCRTKMSLFNELFHESKDLERATKPYIPTNNWLVKFHSWCLLFQLIYLTELLTIWRLPRNCLIFLLVTILLFASQKQVNRSANNHFLQITAFNYLILSNGACQLHMYFRS